MLGFLSPRPAVAGDLHVFSLGMGVVCVPSV
jgi:hypothetical protein